MDATNFQVTREHIESVRKQRSMLDRPMSVGRHEGGFHTFYGTVLRILSEDYECVPDAAWLETQGARMSQAHAMGESADMCAYTVAAYWRGFVLNARRSANPMSLCIKRVRL